MIKDPGSEFAFGLLAKVRLIVSGETGMVIGRAEYTEADDSYLLRYKSADGRAVEQWWTENAIEEVQ
jgi:hypothetical protein